MQVNFGASYPNGTSGDPLEYLKLYAYVDTNDAVYDLAMSGGAGSDIPGGGNYAQSTTAAEEFLIVKSFKDPLTAPAKPATLSTL